MTTRSRPHGFSLLEVILVLAVLAILAAVMLPGPGTFDTARMARARQEIETLRTAADRWLERGRLDYTGVALAALSAETLLPATWTGATPWGGSYTVGPAGGAATRLEITASGLPAAVAPRLAAQLAAAGYQATAAGGTVTALR